MSDSYNYLQAYLREHVLPLSLDPYAKNSSEFFNALKNASLSWDCVNPTNALDISTRTRSVMEPECFYYWASYFFDSDRYFAGNIFCKFIDSLWTHIYF